jgi:hypothetical protein
LDLLSTYERTICLGWLQTSILLISASWVAKIIGVNPWLPASQAFWNGNHTTVFHSPDIPTAPFVLEGPC